MTQKIELNRGERSVLEDCITWFIQNREEFFDDEEESNLMNILDDLEESEVASKRVDPQLMDVVFDTYTSELQRTVKDLEDEDEILDFYEEIFGQLTNKLFGQTTSH